MRRATGRRRPRAGRGTPHRRRRRRANGGCRRRSRASVRAAGARSRPAGRAADRGQMGAPLRIGHKAGCARARALPPRRRRDERHHQRARRPAPSTRSLCPRRAAVRTTASTSPLRSRRRHGGKPTVRPAGTPGARPRSRTSGTSSKSSRAPAPGSTSALSTRRIGGPRNRWSWAAASGSTATDCTGSRTPADARSSHKCGNQRRGSGTDQRVCLHRRARVGFELFPTGHGAR